MTTIEVNLSNQSKAFNFDVHFKIPYSGVTAVFGHSGSGKSTLLRCIAGLEKLAGSLLVNQNYWQTENYFLQVHKRSIGFVFQDSNLFPHLNVEQNLMFGYKRGGEQKKMLLQPQQIIQKFGLLPLLSRTPNKLSGGEKQRVAIVRAILRGPELILMDEPLSALDENTRLEIIPYIEKLWNELKIPIIYVSHSLREVTRLADRVVWLENGQVVEQGETNIVMTNLSRLAQGKDAYSVLSCQLVAHDKKYHLSQLKHPMGKLWINQVNEKIGSQIKLEIAARDVSLCISSEQNQGTILNVFPVIIDEIANSGEVAVMLKLINPDNKTSQSILARITLKSFEQLSLKKGMKVYARIKSVGLVH